ncbi:hypothetical protein OVA11_14290 [Caulobacter sp. SL161]|uniref:hypothetical protein n=1 Tax=Caulobacter sp. SL161 TaxID=2995156 RepID=UPI0022739574|nr:hypothetical protein [Caulobacter sp. SL161]MCY1648190.1 hypothetical protein [Caulobacter sp. SL161]
MITICQIDPATLVWTGLVDQLADDQVEIPAGWIIAEPPVLDEAQTATWTGEAWSIQPPPVELIAIYRVDPETSVYASESTLIEAGAACPAGWVRSAPPPPAEAGVVAVWQGDAWGLQDAAEISIEPARRALRARLDAVFQTISTANFAWDFGAVEAVDDLGVNVGPAGVRSLQMRGLEDKTNWTAVHSAATAAVMAGQASAIIPIKCDDNVWIQTTAMGVLTVLTIGDGPKVALLARQSLNLARYGALKRLIADAADQAALDAIDLSAGWTEG